MEWIIGSGVHRGDRNRVKKRRKSERERKRNGAAGKHLTSFRVQENGWEITNQTWLEAARKLSLLGSLVRDNTTSTYVAYNERITRKWLFRMQVQLNSMYIAADRSGPTDRSCSHEPLPKARPSSWSWPSFNRSTRCDLAATPQLVALYFAIKKMKKALSISLKSNSSERQTHVSHQRVIPTNLIPR